MSGSATSIRRSNPVEPFLKAHEAPPGIELYWLAAGALPLPTAQKRWLRQFLARLREALAQEHQLAGEFFLNYKIAAQVEKRFRQLSIELMPQLGLYRRPFATMPPRPTKEDLESASRGGRFQLNDYIPDATYWLLTPKQDMLLEEFLGFGGAMAYFFPPDPGAAVPEIPHLAEIAKLMPALPVAKLQSALSVATSLKRAFLPQSKELFGAGLEDEPEYKGWLYILPQLRASDFFQQPEAERKKWFAFSPVFWRESPEDQGLLLASALPLQPMLAHILQRMREEGLEYPVDYP